MKTSIEKKMRKKTNSRTNERKRGSRQLAKNVDVKTHSDTATVDPEAHTAVPLLLPNATQKQVSRMMCNRKQPLMKNKKQKKAAINEILFMSQKQQQRNWTKKKTPLENILFRSPFHSDTRTTKNHCHKLHYEKNDITSETRMKDEY